MKNAKKLELTDKALCLAVEEMAGGLHDGDLGGSVYKKRVAIGSRGKRAGARTLVATNRGDRWFFLYGFKKNQRANITPQELDALQYVAEDLLARQDDELDLTVSQNVLEEICIGNET